MSFQILTNVKKVFLGAPNYVETLLGDTHATVWQGIPLAETGEVVKVNIAM